MDPRHRPVSEIMRTEIATLGAKDRLDAAQDVMKIARVRHLPVLEDGRVVGIVSQRDLLEAALSRALDFEPAARRTFLRSVEVGEVMAKEVVTATPETTLTEAARLLVGRRIGCLPVVDAQGTLIGLVSETDLLAEAYLGGDRGDAEAEDGSPLGRFLERELAELRRLREELVVQAHLGKAEAKDRWQALERSLERLEATARRASRAAGEPLEQLREDARRLARDLREGYRRVRDSL